MPQAWIPPRGELEKKVVFSPCCGNETTTSYDRAYRILFRKRFLSAGEAGGVHLVSLSALALSLSLSVPHILPVLLLK